MIDENTAIVMTDPQNDFFPDMDDDQAALINFNLLANKVYTTKEFVTEMEVRN